MDVVKNVLRRTQMPQRSSKETFGETIFKGSQYLDFH